jgi:hypothetical protein
MSFYDSFWGTTNLKVAAAEITLGSKIREYDPCTCTINEQGVRQFTWWFSSGGEAKAEMERPWAQLTSPEESPIRYIRAVLENRETLWGLTKRAEPILVIQRGGQTLLVAERARPEIKRDLLRKL